MIQYDPWHREQRAKQLRRQNRALIVAWFLVATAATLGYLELAAWVARGVGQ